MWRSVPRAPRAVDAHIYRAPQGFTNTGHTRPQSKHHKKRTKCTQVRHGVAARGWVHTFGLAQLPGNQRACNPAPRKSNGQWRDTYQHRAVGQSREHSDKHEYGGMESVTRKIGDEAGERGEARQVSRSACVSTLRKQVTHKPQPHARSAHIMHHHQKCTTWSHRSSRWPFSSPIIKPSRSWPPPWQVPRRVGVCLPQREQRAASSCGIANHVEEGTIRRGRRSWRWRRLWVQRSTRQCDRAHVRRPEPVHREGGVPQGSQGR